MNLDFYSSFEEKFRGSRSTVKSRLEVYLPFITPLLTLYPQAKAVDLGCGRGEWLELLNENGFSAYGVDLNEDMLAPAKEMGLTVHCDEAISFLKKLPNQSQIVVSAFHIVEHIPFHDVEILVQEALRALCPGGVLIIETPNPENIVVGTANFYLDPTHRHPIPPQLLAFLPEYYGFSKFKLLRLQENNKITDTSRLSLLDVFRGVSPDCAIVAQKLAEEEILSLNNQAFEADYGVTLDHLATTYDAQNATIIKEISSLTKLLCEFEFNQLEIDKEFKRLASLIKKLDADSTHIQQLTQRLKESDSDRSEQAKQVEVLTAMLKESESDRASRANQIETLTLMLKESETDRADRFNQIKRLTALLNESESEQTVRQTEIEKLALAAHKVSIQKIDIKVGETQNWKSFLPQPLYDFLKKCASLNGQGIYKEIVMIETLKRVAVDLTPILPGGENGGAKIFVLELLCQLAKLAPETEFILLTQAASHNELKAMECKNISCAMVLGNSVTTTSWFGSLASTLRKLPYLGRSLISLGYRINTLLKRRQAYSLLGNIKADLLFCPFTAPTYFEPGIPTVCTIYDLQYKTYPEFFNAEEQIHRNHTFIEACRRASMLTAISEYSRQSAIVHGGLKPEKIRTIHLQMAHRILPDKEQDKSILNRLGLVPQQYLLYPANFWKHKNHEMLLSAFSIACHGKLPATIKLVCTGAEGERHTFLTEAAARMNLAERVLLPGFLTNAELAILMSNSNAVVFPSLYEGFGLPVIEAMAAGIPVACSNLTSLPEIAGDAALLFNPRIPTQVAEALISLSTDQELRKKLISAGKERAKLFSDSQRMAQEYWYLFKSALNNKKQEDELTGAYEDGWVGPQMNIQIAPSTSQQTLEMEFYVPDWLPQTKIVVQAVRGGKTQGIPLEILRGNKASLSLALPAKGAHYEIRMTPTFVPSQTGYSDNDKRELSLIIQRCSVKRNQGESIELISRKKSA